MVLRNQGLVEMTNGLTALVNMVNIVNIVINVNMVNIVYVNLLLSSWL